MKLSRLLIIVLALSITISAQTDDFTYQGRLLDSSLPPTASYDFRFELFSVPSGGTILSTDTRTGVPVVNGIFTTPVNFGSSFTGADRWIQISVRPAGSTDPYVVLTGRQRVTSTPYAMVSGRASFADYAAEADLAQDANSLGGVEASQFVVTTDPRMTDSRTPLPFSDNYIQNTPSQQAASNFFISGLGRANILSANTQFNLGTNRILASPGSFNFFAGIGTGASITTGGSNTLVGGQAGDSLSQGGNNSFFGAQAGRSTSSANGNSFFGANAGRLNTDGGLNSFFGLGAGEETNSGTDNSFFGAFSGTANSNGSGNSFFGRSSGSNNGGGNLNSFFGYESGNGNTDGQGNSFFGTQSGRANTTGSVNTFLGYGAGQANTTSAGNTFVGVDSGFSNTLGESNVFVGISAGRSNLEGDRNAVLGSYAGSLVTGDDNAFFGGSAGLNTIGGSGNSMFGGFAGEGNVTGTYNSALGFSSRFASPGLTNSTAIGSRAQVASSNSIVLGAINGVNGATADTNVGIGITAPTDRLHVVGNSRFAGNVIVTGGLTAAFSPGIAALPGISFSGDPATGIFSSGVGNLSLSTAGVSRMSIASNGDIAFGSSLGLLGATRFRVSGEVESHLVGVENSSPSGTGGFFIGNASGIIGGSLGIGGGRAFGVQGIAAHDSGDGSRIGVYGEALVATAGGSAGIYGKAPVAVNSFAGYFEGNVGVGNTLSVNSIVPTGSTLALGQSDDTVNVPGTLRVGSTSTPRGQLNIFAPSGNSNLYMQGAGGTVGINLGTGTGPGNPFFFISHYNGTTYTDRLVITSNGEVRINTLGSAGGTALCRNALNEISTCSSSMRYKFNVLDYQQSRSVLDRLRPVSFSWKGSDLLDLGLVAEEVAKIEPLLVTYNDKGEVEGVKYDRIGVVLVNVVKEQQSQIEAQQKQIDELKALVCEIKPEANVCRKEGGK